MRRHAIQTAAFDLATQVRTVEDQIETTLAELAELQSRMIHARSVARVATSTGHEAFEQVAAVMQGLVSARGGMANAHQILKASQAQVPGLREVAFGDVGECPDPSEKPSGILRSVA